jgi:hypothetical protein
MKSVSKARRLFSALETAIETRVTAFNFCSRFQLALLHLGGHSAHRVVRDPQAAVSTTGGAVQGDPGLIAFGFNA